MLKIDIKSLKARNRFFNKIDLSSISGCWTWKGAKSPEGYGTFWNKGKEAVHRIAYATWVGHVPKGFLVCHKCDNPPCLRPDHLFLGTNKDNCLDKMKKGRHKSHYSRLCKRGHKFDKSYRGARVCSLCRKIQRRERYLKYKK